MTNLSVTPPADSDDDFALTVTATATEADNSDRATRVDTIDVEVTAVADQPTLTVPSTITVDEDTQSATFTISSALTDTDGSETLTLGDQQRAGGHHADRRQRNTFTATSGNTTVDVTDWTLDQSVGNAAGRQRCGLCADRYGDGDRSGQTAIKASADRHDRRRGRRQSPISRR